MMPGKVKSRQRKQECSARRWERSGEGPSADSGTMAERLSIQPETRPHCFRGSTKHVQAVPTVTQPRVIMNLSQHRIAYLFKIFRLKKKTWYSPPSYNGTVQSLSAHFLDDNTKSQCQKVPIPASHPEATAKTSWLNKRSAWECTAPS